MSVISVRSAVTGWGDDAVPVGVVLDALHEEVRDPEAQEEIACARLLSTGVLAQVKERENVGVPRLNVHRERA